MDKAKFEVWLKGLITALISGAAGGVSSMLSTVLVTPEHAQVPGLLMKTAALTALISAIIGVAAYLKQSPLPPE